MAETRAPHGGATGTTEEDRLRTVDWEGIERSPEFQELVHRRRAFVVPATIFFLTYYMAFILLAGYAEDFMASSVYEGLTVGYCLALTQFLMVLVLGLMYLRRADHEYDPLAQRVVTLAGHGDGGEHGRAAERRFARREAANGGRHEEVTR
ncbi:MAG: DUF485 domain-containing protein [Solirubrobacteraceae bacterium]